MTHLSRVRVALTGFPGGPGVSTFYFLDTATALPSLKTLFDTFTNYQDTNVTAQVEGSGDIIEDTTGELVGAWGDTAPAASTGTRSDSVAPAQGFQVQWQTASILDGRRLRGRTFIVPVASNTYTDGGLIDATVQGAVYAAALEFIIEQSASFVIWHRPFPGRAAAPPKPAKPAHDGGHALVTMPVVPRKTVVLRSRRD